MSFFPRSYINEPATSFSPFFRFLDDFDNYQNQNQNQNTNRNNPRSQIMKTFVPKFDVKEVEGAYELHGELPGMEQENVTIEFVDDQTLTVKGHTERSYTSGTPPAGALENSASAGAITEGGEQSHKSHKATVEDEDAANAESQVAKTGSKEAVKAETKPQEKYWVSERSVGEFSRSFSFPARVDLENVKASMKNGVLSIVVPKGKKLEGRKIAIN